MDGINCSICFLEFNGTTVIPKILKCGHSFCSPCLDQLIITSPVCPNCRKTFCAREDCATNFALLELVNSINSNKWKELNATRRIEGLKDKFTAKEEEIRKNKTKLLTNLEKVQKALTQIKKLSSERRVELNVESINEDIANLESVYQGLQIQTAPDYSSIKANVSLKFDTSESPSAYLLEIRRHLQNGDQIYSIANAEDGIQYRKIPTEDGLLLIHAVDNLEILEGQTSVWVLPHKSSSLKSSSQQQNQVDCAPPGPAPPGRPPARPRDILQDLNLKSQREDTACPPDTERSRQMVPTSSSSSSKSAALSISRANSHAYSHSHAHETQKPQRPRIRRGFRKAQRDTDDNWDRRVATLVNKMNTATGQEACHDKTSLSSSRTTNLLSRATEPAAAAAPFNSKEPVPEKSCDEGKRWACMTCTYENRCEVMVCEMCGKSKGPGPDTKPLGGKQCPLCTLINERHVEVCCACGVDLRGVRSLTYI